MNSRNYVFIVGVVFFAISMMQHSCVQDSQVLSDEIEKFILPIEETQIDKPIQQDLSEPNLPNKEEEPAIKDEKQTENENEVQNTKTDIKQTLPEKKPTTISKPKDIPVETPKTSEDNLVQTISIEEPVVQTEAKTHKLSLAKFFDKCSNFFSKLSFDKIIELKEAIVQHFSSKQVISDLCCKQISEHKQISGPKDFIPYYFLYPEPIKKHLERIIFTDNITNPKDYLTYIYTIKNYEVKIPAPEKAVTPQGTTDIFVLMNAPSPEIEVTGKPLYAKLVIDIRNNTLYKYDADGFPLKAYLVATGARGSRTKTGLRIVTHKEQFPYKWAPINSKRLYDPYSYGPFIIFLNAVNPKTGKQVGVDQFLHGNGNENSIGKKVSHGCMRTNNNVMRNELIKEVNKGDYILIMNPDIN